MNRFRDTFGQIAMAGDPISLIMRISGLPEDAKARRRQWCYSLAKDCKAELVYTKYSANELRGKERLQETC